ncbi:MAG: nicotinamide riboside transporter PnuC [Dysgonomonas sp.]|nr:nicotinamide riboside transporter PnuC [Dysgonomonas sp.]
MFDIENIFVHILGYPLSYVELLGTLCGLLCVYWASKENILTWPVGILNELFFFVIFFQVQLYANMFLQIIFFFSSVYGWYKWRSKDKEDGKIGSMKPKGIAITTVFIIVGTILTGYFVSNLHTTLPDYFAEASLYPYTDSFIMVISIAATILLAKKKFESWILWIINDVVCVILYYLQGVHFIALQYLILLFIASYGLYNWQKKRA